MKVKSSLLAPAIAVTLLGSVTVPNLLGSKSEKKVEPKVEVNQNSTSSSSNIMFDKDGNVVDTDGKIVMKAEKFKSNQSGSEMFSSEKKVEPKVEVNQNSTSSSSNILFDKDGNVVDTDGKIVMTAEKFKSNQSGSIMASIDGVNIK